MFWNCPKLVRYWTEVIDRIKSVLLISVDTTPLTYILGYVEDLPTEVEGKIAIARILYMARKVIAQRWLDPRPPTVKQFEGKVNWLISLERGIYRKRGSLSKFEKIMVCLARHS